jgi:hypothetical protein
MCDLSRRQFLAGGTLLTLAAEAELLGGPGPAGVAQAATADLIAPDVYFHEKATRQLRVVLILDGPRSLTRVVSYRPYNEEGGQRFTRCESSQTHRLRRLPKPYRHASVSS